MTSCFPLRGKCRRQYVQATLKSSETPFRAQRDGACQRPSSNVGYTVVLPPQPSGQLPRWGAKNVLPLNLIALRSRGIFVIRGKAVNVRKPQAGNLRSRNLRASPYLYSAVLPYLYVPHRHFAFLISHANETFKRNQRAARPTG